MNRVTEAVIEMENTSPEHYMAEAAMLEGNYLALINGTDETVEADEAVVEAISFTPDAEPADVSVEVVEE